MICARCGLMISGVAVHSRHTGKNYHGERERAKCLAELARQRKAREKQAAVA